MTQDYIASEPGMSRPTYIQIEHGKREITVTEAKKLSEIFNMSLNDFLAGHEPKYEVNLPGRVSEEQSSINVRVTGKILKNLNRSSCIF
jgi:transcriptional regulator with XRE-family HTH domain